jgi:hypothetical protein
MADEAPAELVVEPEAVLLGAEAAPTVRFLVRVF